MFCRDRAVRQGTRARWHRSSRRYSRWNTTCRRAMEGGSNIDYCKDARSCLSVSSKFKDSSSAELDAKISLKRQRAELVQYEDSRLKEKARRGESKPCGYAEGVSPHMHGQHNSTPLLMFMRLVEWPVIPFLSQA